MLYLITYNLNKNKDHSELFNAIKSTCTAWWHYLDSTWIIRTSDNVGTIYHRLEPYIDKATDHLLIVKVDASMGNKQGWLPREAWDWINKNRD